MERMLPSRALVWLMVGFSLLVLIQWDRLQPWLLGACGVLLLWRWLAQTGTISLPGRWLRSVVMVGLLGAFVVSVRGVFTVETAGSFFVLTVALKWLETRTQRDFYVLLFILIYLAAVNFLFKQGLFWTLLNVAAVLLLFIALQILNAPEQRRPVRASGRRLLVLIMKTLPVVILLFIFFPRLEPLWSVPLVSDKARTGLSDTMAPGSISDLAQSSERAFRVTFGGAIPDRNQRYWRGLILDIFDGEEWQASRDPNQQSFGQVRNDGGMGPLAENEYDVLMEPTNRRWAFGLTNSDAVSGNVQETSEGLFRFKRPADSTVRYRLAMNQESTSPQSGRLDSAYRQHYLRLPPDGNPRARELGRTLARESENSFAVIQSLMARFSNQPYFYTLKPPLMPEDSVDTLLFEAKRGFCAHYASATAFTLRAAGIPARVVVGYQGGSRGAQDYLIVRQYDAHAWVEAYLPSAGWIRVDPTAAIAPERIESGLETAVQEEGSFLQNEWVSAEKYRDVPLVKWVSLQMDLVNYHWQRWVVGYQADTQLSLMDRLPGELSLRDLGHVSAGIVAAALLIGGIYTGVVRLGRERGSPVDRLYHRWLRMLIKSGVPISPGDTPDELARRASRMEPAKEPYHLAFARALNSHYYGDQAGAEERRLRWLLRKMPRHHKRRK